MSGTRKLSVFTAALGTFLLATTLDSARAQTNTFPTTGNVGIGTTSPADIVAISGPATHFLANTYSFDLTATGTSGGWARAFRVTNSDNSIDGKDGGAFGVLGSARTPTYVYMAIPTSDLNGWDSSKILVLNNSGNVGIGTTSPVNPLNVYTPGGGSPVGAMSVDVGTFGTTANATSSYFFRVCDIGGSSTPFQIQGNGNVGIGTTAPSAKLEINGTLRFSGDASGTVQTTAWTGVLCGGDYAESVDVNGDRKHYGPGDVLVIDPDNPDGFTKSVHPYSTVVAGIYSTKPGVVGRKSIDPEKLKTEIPMAMIGIVPTKVSAENGPIKRGDLLVTSGTEGYAMKGTDHGLMLGAIVGKALGSLNSGTGLMDVLVSLQ